MVGGELQSMEEMIYIKPGRVRTAIPQQWKTKAKEAQDEVEDKDESKDQM